MTGMCEVCEVRAWILIRKVYFVRKRICVDCFMDILYLLPKAIWRPRG